MAQLLVKFSSQVKMKMLKSNVLAVSFHLERAILFSKAAQLKEKPLDTVWL